MCSAKYNAHTEPLLKGSLSQICNPYVTECFNNIFTKNAAINSYEIGIACIIFV